MDPQRFLSPGDRIERLLDRAVLEHAEQLRAVERADLALTTAAATIDRLGQFMLDVGYLVKK